MNYWPLSTVKTSPLMPAAYAWELSLVYKTCRLSPLVFQACGEVARQTQPVQTGLIIIESANAPSRHAYTELPTWEEWFRLERGGVIEASDGMLYVIIDALH